jgi:diguanylate cyclase (GGDEF)-like protein
MSAATGEKFSESIDWKLAEELFSNPVLVIVAGLVPGGVAIMGFLRTGQTWFIAYAILAMMVLGVRLAVQFAFARRHIQLPRPVLWRRRFLIAAWVHGALCGVGAAATVLLADSFTQMMVITSLTAFVLGSAAHNSSYPKAAVGAVLLAQVPLILALCTSPDRFFLPGALLSALFAVAALSIIRHFYAQTVRFLVTEEANVLLVSEVTKSNVELASANEKLALMAATDALTGVPNRRSFDTAVGREVRAARRERSELSLLMFDIDSFKQYNDRFGHQAGDACLRRVAQALSAGLRRPRDLLARYGGEEFVAILPHTDRAAAIGLAHRLRACIEGLGLPDPGSAIGVVTLSVGVATLVAGGVETPDAILLRADQALYMAKQRGRNRVEAVPAESLVGALALREVQST